MLSLKGKKKGVKFDLFPFLATGLIIQYMVDAIVCDVLRRLNVVNGFQKVKKGTRSEVFISNDLVIKVNPEMTAVRNEAEVIKEHVLDNMPEFVAFYLIRNYGVLVEQKLNGSTIDDVWRDIDVSDKQVIIADIVKSTQRVNQQKRKYFWSAQFDIKFKSYGDLLLHRLRLNQKRIFENSLARNLFMNISENVNEKRVKHLFDKITPVLLHGDLIMHNLLTDSHHLTGILDWEYAQFGDPFYDLARVVYYQESAKAYVDQQRDEHFEYDFTTRLIEQLKQYMDWNIEKYIIIRSLFFVDTIIWAIRSRDPESKLAGLQVPDLPSLS